MARYSLKTLGENRSEACESEISRRRSHALIRHEFAQTRKPIGLIRLRIVLGPSGASCAALHRYESPHRSMGEHEHPRASCALRMYESRMGPWESTSIHEHPRASCALHMWESPHRSMREHEHPRAPCALHMYESLMGQSESTSIHEHLRASCALHM